MSEQMPEPRHIAEWSIQRGKMLFKAGNDAGIDEDWNRAYLLGIAYKELMAERDRLRQTLEAIEAFGVGPNDGVWFVTTARAALEGK